MAAAPEELAPGLWHWTERHPEWHPGEFGAEVGCYAAQAGDELLLIDPLATGPALERLDELARGASVSILVSIGYHARSSEELAERYDCLVHGHPAVAGRFSDTARFREMAAGDELPGGASAHAIGKPRRQETPLYLPSHRALVFGDALAVTPEGELRIWAGEKPDERKLRWYAESFAPTLEPLLDLDLERILVTHGEPVLEGGHAALAEALRAPAWYHR